jgi:acyl-coenzyme A thioesterase PaaI-like protein
VVPLSHHDLCFGCGLANVFGLQLELDRTSDDAVAGRFFVKQDHQGPPGFAHGGVLAAALDEAMALLVQGRLTAHLEVDLRAPAPVGAFVEVEAHVEREDAGTSRARATIRSEGGAVLAEGSAVLVAADRGQLT